MHFSLVTLAANTVGGVHKTQTLKHQLYYHNYQSNSQANDLFVDPMGNVMAETYNSILFIY